MRALIVLTGLTMVGCRASQPVQPQPNVLAVQTPMGTNAVAANSAVPTASIEQQRLAAAKNLNLKVIDKDGQQLFCRSNMMTGSHIQRDTRCFTAEQVDMMEQATQRDLDVYMNRSDVNNQSMMGKH